MSEWWQALPLLKLIEEYGNECAVGGAGYTYDDSDKLLDEIKQRLMLGEYSDRKKEVQQRAACVHCRK